MRRASLAIAVLLCSAAFGQQAVPLNGPSRFHYGDNPRWADPNFDDSSWPVAHDGGWPPPAFSSDGFVWVRVHVAVPRGLSEPLGLRERTFGGSPGASEIYLNGLLLGENGKLPPGPQTWTAPLHLVFPIPSTVLSAGSLGSPNEAVVAVRAWFTPWQRVDNVYAMQFTIDKLTTQEALARDLRDTLLLGQMPTLAAALLLAVCGFGVAAIGFITKRRELLLFAIVLITGPLQVEFYQLTGSGLMALRWWVFATVLFLFLCAVPISYIQFLWEVLDLGYPGWKYAAWAASVLAALGFWVQAMATQPGPGLRLVDGVFVTANCARDLLESAAAIWALSTRRSGRILAFAILLTPAASFTAIISYLLHAPWAAFTGTLFNVCVLVGGAVIAGILLQRAWKEWRSGERLRIELSAARDVQQQLVPLALPAIAGYAFDPVYLPATEVGGDFYQVFQKAEGSALVAIGDVSGKGLKAAMTGALVLGALRALAQEELSPSQILGRLNAQLASSSDGGFVTCLCAHITADGAVIFANAGHLAPYCDGEEMRFESGLPLGISADAEYSEASVSLTAGGTLTLLSDGVVEARNDSGELFGFDRARSISTQSAQAIADAAKQFGQEDDITVVTIQRVPVPAYA